ncbi:hypothetical protein PCK1_002818 [Pneumocystis canis]|nr:hypothetical protein PCK1_002818 [Pneumocystis canis]
MENSKTQIDAPSAFLQHIVGRPVFVRLSSGIDYKGILSCLDGCMNVALEDCKEYVKGELKNEYGDTFIRGNNGKFHIVRLQYPPDKSINNCYTIDEIIQAFHLLQQQLSPLQSPLQLSKLIYETLYLDDFVYLNDIDCFYRKCRYGDVFVLIGDDLEKGHTVVGCSSCTLWIKIVASEDTSLNEILDPMSDRFIAKLSLNHLTASKVCWDYK